MWTVDPEQVWNKPRDPGISGFMRLKNEAEFLDQAIGSHLAGLDELIVVYNDCVDETPEICARWAHRYPDKIKVIEYEPKVIPIGTPRSLSIDPRSPNCIANYYNFALSLTNRKIVIKIDGDHLAIAPRFNRICNTVREKLQPDQRYPIYGLNITVDSGEIVIYNHYHFSPGFVGDSSTKKGPPPFTSGDHAFFYVDQSSWHTVDPVEGFERIDLGGKSRFPKAAFTYSFFHLKGMKADRGIGNWGIGMASSDHLRSEWAKSVASPDARHLAPIEMMRRHNPEYFRGVDYQKELNRTFPHLVVRAGGNHELPALKMRERIAGLWYRLAYP